MDVNRVLHGKAVSTAVMKRAKRTPPDDLRARRLKRDGDRETIRRLCCKPLLALVFCGWLGLIRAGGDGDIMIVNGVDCRKVSGGGRSDIGWHLGLTCLAARV